MLYQVPRHHQQVPGGESTIDIKVDQVIMIVFVAQKIKFVWVEVYVDVMFYHFKHLVHEHSFVAPGSHEHRLYDKAHVKFQGA